MAIENLKPINHYSMESCPTIYDEEATTALKLAAKTAGKVNEIIKLLKEECQAQNMSITEAVNYLKTNLDITAHELLYAMADNGELDILLRENYEEVRQNILPIANVKEFGAVGDGVHDDSEAITQAMLEHHQIYFPEGTYRVTDSIDLYSFLHLYGAGVGKTIIKYEGNEYLFNVKARFGNQPIIEGMTFEGLASNGLLNCDCGKWGATVAMRDFTAYQFKDVMRFASAFGCIIENALIMTYGKITFTTYDGTAQETNFNNCNVFRNVYMAAYSTERNTQHFELFNVRDLTFEKCQLERVEKLMVLSNKCRNIKLKDCWLEDVDVMYTKDSGSLSPVSENCNFVRVSKRDGNATDLDYLAGAPTIKDISGSKNAQVTMLQHDIVLASESMECPSDGYSDWLDIYRISTKAADFRMPLNIRMEAGENVTEMTQDLNKILRYSPINALFHITVYCRYSDFGYRVFRVEVIRRGSTWICNVETIKDTTWAGSAGEKATTSITCSGGTLAVSSDVSLINCDIITEFNILPK